MFTDNGRSRVKRRGVVLILILGMLGLMALIGVTFATFAGQSLINNRNYVQSVNMPSPEQLMDYALAQLINDTNNPMSSLRGHSLLRDMYGNDSVMGNGGAIRAYLDRLPDGTALVFTNTGAFPTLSNGGTPFPTPTTNLTGFIQFATNIPVHSPYSQLYGLDFTRWILRLNHATSPVSQSLEVLHDDISTGFHILTLAGADSVTRAYSNPNMQYMYGIVPPNNTTGPAKTPVFMNQPGVLGTFPLMSQFALDGRNMRAFNGPGMTQPNSAGQPDATYGGAGQPHNSAAFANFRTNGGLLAWPFLTNNTNNNLLPTSPSLGNPDQMGMDEDYDACDLENWFLAIQSADGQVMIPSFHRPGILVASYNANGTVNYSDWTADLNSANGTERQRAVMAVSKILRPRQIDHTPAFPADPAIPDPITGQIKYDVDNDGDGITDSVWLDLGYPVQQDSRGKSFKPLFAFMVLGLNGRLPLNTVGNLQGRDYTDASLLPIKDGNGNVVLSYPDRPTWTHASHLGYSVNEINPLYALQNACDAIVTNNSTPPTSPGLWFSQVDNAGIDAGTTQLRNILAGTLPQDNPTKPNFNFNQEQNFLLNQGNPYYMPNGLADQMDLNWAYPMAAVTRSTQAVAGRWGEPEGIPRVLVAPSFIGVTNTSVPYTMIAYENPVRAGRSFLTTGGGSGDAFDDDFDTTDFLAVPPMGVTNDTLGNPYMPVPASNNERWNAYDVSGSGVLPVERIRRYVTPYDPVGVGRLVSWDKRPSNFWDYGIGYDAHGRVNQFRYFRPPGLPPVVTYDTNLTDIPGVLPYLAYQPANERYNMPILAFPAHPDITNNQFNGYWSKLFPGTGVGGGGLAGIAVSGAMPFNFFTDPVNVNNSQLYAPGGAVNTSSTPAPLPAPFSPPTYPSMSVSINSSQGPYLGPGATSPNGGASVINGYPNYPPFMPTTVSAMVPTPNVGSSLNKDEADEMDLYGHATNVDMPFGSSDLEWLYRKQDVDGASLDSRLAKLAPISFLNPADGQMRRRLFSVDVWDTITASYAFDNPNNAFPFNSRFFYPPASSFATAPATAVPGSSLAAMGVSTFQNPFPVLQIPNPAQFHATPLTPNNLSIPQETTNVPPYWQAPINPAETLPMSLTTLATYLGTSPNVVFPPALTPSIAHKDRKINLNFPLPVSNAPDEPVRQKWVRETYQLMKKILPPQAVDTPQELAQLSQYIVNIIDFRDPDCSMTRFVNTDVQVIAPTTTNPAGLVFATDPVPDPNNTHGSAQTHFPYDPTIYEDTAYTSALTNQFLVQHGMEYSPVAITEVLAYSYKRKSGSGSSATSVDTQRFFIELTNTLTDDGPATNSSDLDLSGWDMIVVPDMTVGGATNITGRPDPMTGEVPPAALSLPGVRAPWSISLAGQKVKAIRGTTSQYFILGFPNPGGAFSGAVGEPTLNASTLPMDFLPVGSTMGKGKGQYFWLYLRRPANPFDTTSTTKEMAVVDSFRFPYVEAGGDGSVNAMGTEQLVSAQVRPIFSMKRHQPFRGGHNVPTTGGANPPVPSTVWGYSEQTAPGQDATKIVLKWGSLTTVYPKGVQEDLGTAGTNAENWDYFAFHDRDFTGVGELLLVPGCPPGLFTKQFEEVPYNSPSDAKGTAWDDTKLSTATAAPTYPDIGKRLTGNVPGVYPYLPDGFYYTAASVAPYAAAVATDPYPSKINGWTGAGWYKMLEFFEVPSSANGAIGPVTEGENFDWERQPVKPGQINLNLIIDEEVFFGLIDDPRLNTQIMTSEVNLLCPIPRVVTQIDAFGYPLLRQSAAPTGAVDLAFTGAYPISGLSTYQVYDPGMGAPLQYDAVAPFNVGPPTLNGRGYNAVRAINGKTYYTQGMKAAFSDFLKLRHGGSSFLFAWGSGATGQGNFMTTIPPTYTSTAQIGPVASDRPYRSLSFPDINYTIMRPATLPPSPFTNPASPPASWATDIAGDSTAPALYPLMPPYQYYDVNGNMYVPKAGTNANKGPSDLIYDPGVKNPYFDTTAMNPRLVPLIPTRRLFQLPDKANTGTPPSNAAVFDNTTSTNANVNIPTISTDLVSGLQMLSTIAPQLGGIVNTNDPLGPPSPPATWYLGDSGSGDQRQHPAYRIEWLQKVMNLTTVRTNQFAVWITIGFFEVVQAGAPALALPDKLGSELSLASGRSIRYRSFFVLDRTRAVGFNPSNPVDFRDVVTYRRRIE